MGFGVDMAKAKELHKKYIRIARGENFEELDLVIENLSKSSTNINSITNEIKAGDGLVNKVVYDEGFVKSLDEISSNINLLLEDLRMNPKRYVHFSLFGKKNKEYTKEK